MAPSRYLTFFPCREQHVATIALVQQTSGGVPKVLKRRSCLFFSPCAVTCSNWLFLSWGANLIRPSKVNDRPFLDGLRGLTPISGVGRKTIKTDTTATLALTPRDWDVIILAALKAGVRPPQLFPGKAESVANLRDLASFPVRAARVSTSVMWRSQPAQPFIPVRRPSLRPLAVHCVWLLSRCFGIYSLQSILTEKQVPPHCCVSPCSRLSSSVTYFRPVCFGFWCFTGFVRNGRFKL